MGVSVNWPLSVLCVFVSMCVCVRVCVCVCVCVYQIRVPVKKDVLSDLSTHDALLHKTHIKVFLVLK